MDEVNKIRKKFFVKGETRGKIAKSCRRSWDTVNRIVNMNREELENRGKHTTRQKIVMTDDVIKAIHNLLDYEEVAGVKKKQRYTAAQIFRELSEQGVYRGSRIRMEEVIGKIKSERKQSPKLSFLPLEFPLGSALQAENASVLILQSNNVRVSKLFPINAPIAFVLPFAPQS